MKKMFKLVSVVLVFTVFVSACSAFGWNVEEPTGGEAPNLTLTALFDTSLNIPPTVTPAIGVADTLVPTAVPATVVPTSTSTTAPTVTASLVPPPTLVPVMERAGAQMKAIYLSTAPVIDGTYEEWLDEDHKYKLPFVVWDGKDWKDQADLEGAYAAAWDEDYLYISVKVTDDIFVQKQTGALMYLGDSVEFLIDTNLKGDFYVQSLDGDDYQFGVSPGNPAKSIAPEVYLWNPSSKAGTKSQVLLGSLFETDPIYRVEVGIPWSMIGVTPVKGMRLGFAVSICDQDSTSKTVQETMISTAQYRNYLNPTTWGELVLIK